MNAQEHFQAGQLAEAIAEALSEVKRYPAEIHRRSFLCELLCFAGDLERADKQLDIIVMQDPDAMVGVALFRQLIRAEQARREFFELGRVPEFVDQPTDNQKLYLEASVNLREGDLERVSELLAQAESQRPKCQGTCDGQPFDGFRDLDDLVAGSFEVLTSNGKYYWIPIERVEMVEFRPPESTRDLLWRAAHMIVRDGPDGVVYLPTLYFDSYSQADGKIQLGRATDWVGSEDDAVRGIGQRMYLVGDEDRPILTLERLDFTNV